MQPRSHGESKEAVPTLQVGILKVWVDGRQFPESQDGWDDNWLNIRAVCEDKGATVAIADPCLDTVSFWNFREGLERVYKTLTGQAVLEALEPTLKACVVARGRTGRMTLEVEISPELAYQRHSFKQEIDQSYLPAVISACDDLLRQYPVREAASRGIDLRTL